MSGMLLHLRSTIRPECEVGPGYPVGSRVLVWTECGAQVDSRFVANEFRDEKPEATCDICRRREEQLMRMIFGEAVEDSGCWLDEGGNLDQRIIGLAARYGFEVPLPVYGVRIEDRPEWATIVADEAVCWLQDHTTNDYAWDVRDGCLFLDPPHGGTLIRVTERGKADQFCGNCWCGWRTDSCDDRDVIEAQIERHRESRGES